VFQVLHLKEAWQLIKASWPIVMVRLGLLFMLWLVAVLYIGIVGTGVQILRHIHFWLSIPVLLLGMTGLTWLASLAQRFVLLPLKGIQLAVMAEVLNGTAPPPSANQMDWGYRRMVLRYGQPTGMFAVDDMVGTVVRGYSEQVYGIYSWIPFEKLKGFSSITGGLVRHAVGYVDEAILARHFWVDDDNVWANAVDGVVLYAMAWKTLLRDAVALMVFSYTPAFVMIMLMGGPFALLGSRMASAGALWSLVDALVLGWIIKTAVGDSFAMAAMTVAYRHATEHLEPDTELASCMEHLPRYGALVSRAQQPPLMVRPSRPVRLKRSTAATT
jgi:hypothetical protein